jgi:hypothetical protein
MVWKEFLVVVAVASVIGCRADDRPVVRSQLDGYVTVRPEVDSTQDYRGFEVLVASSDGEADTLGYGVTDSTGYFRILIEAPERGIYPLIVSRRGARVKYGQIVLAEADTASMRLRVPDGDRPLIIRSVENAAWMAYRNSKMVHNRELLSLIQSGQYSAESHATRFMQSAQILWALSEQFPGTIGAGMASVESVLMIEGVNDSLVVERVMSLPMDGPGFVDVVRAARRAEARLRGQVSAIALVRNLSEKTTDQELQAALASEMVVAYADSNMLEEAVIEANKIDADYADSPWAQWARGTVYEIENLMPGMLAPSFSAVTWTGEEYSFDPSTTGIVLLEFFRPTDATYIRERAMRDSLASYKRGENVTFVSVSLEPDSDLNEAFFGSQPSTVQIALPLGSEDPLARSFNVRVHPKRFLIKDGVILGKYSGPAIQAVADDLMAVTGTESS